MRKWITILLMIVLLMSLSGCNKNVVLSEEESILQILSKDSSNFLLTDSGRVFSWGYNGDGRLGTGSNSDEKSPIEITQNFDLAVDEKVTLMRNLGHPKGPVFLTSHNNLYNLGRYVSRTYGIDNGKPFKIIEDIPLNEDEYVVDMKYSEYSWGGLFLLTSQSRLLQYKFIQGDDGSYPKLQTEPIDLTPSLNLKENESIEYFLICVTSYFITSEQRLLTWYVLGTRNDNVEENEYYYFSDLEEDDRIIYVGTLFRSYFFVSSKGKFFSNSRIKIGLDYFENKGYYSDNRLHLESMDLEWGLEEGEYVDSFYFSHSTSIITTSNNRVLLTGLYLFRTVEDEIDAGEKSLSGVGIDFISNLQLHDHEVVKQISIDSNKIFFLTSDDRVIAMGSNYKNRIGPGNRYKYDNPLEVDFIKRG